ncbi:MAG: hypothetical protein R3F26_04315 [Gammaproteobacteria bacterium]
MKLEQLLKQGIRDGKLAPDLYVGTAVTSIFGLFYHLLQGFLCGFFNEAEFRRICCTHWICCSRIPEEVLNE